MKILASVITAFSMFSRIPMPKIPWREENMRWMLAAFPLVGAAMGLIWFLWALLCRALGFSNALFAAGATVLMALTTGGVHLDGFCDTLDALASCQTPQRKREILKDSHAGAFAVIGCCGYFLLYFALLWEIGPDPARLAPALLAPVMARCVSGLASALLPVAGGTGLLRTFHESADTRRVTAALLIWFVLAAAGGILLSPLGGAMMAGGALLSLLAVKRMAASQFGGMSGDIAGFLLCVAEAVMLLMLTIAIGVGA